MLNNGFNCFLRVDGNLFITAGTVIQPRSGVVISVGAATGSLLNPAPVEQNGFSVVTPPDGQTFVGGSGRNFSSAGLVALTGWFVPTVPGSFVFADFVLTVAGSSAAEISDGTDVVAELTTGGTAPAGSYVATAYGETAYNSGSPFALTLVEEIAGGGAIPNALVAVSAGSAPALEFVAVDAANYELPSDTDWTIFIDPSGDAELRYQGTAMAIRTGGLAYDPAGIYESTTAGLLFNPAEAETEPDEPLPTVNPFGVLTLVFSWPAAPDLDIGVTFLGLTAGFDHSGSGAVGAYMNWSGDDTSVAGSETVTIDLATAWNDGVITTFADVLCAADWFPTAGGSGLGTLTATYSIPGADFTDSIYPGNVTPSTTLAKSLRILADGSIELVAKPWRAFVRQVARLPRAGFAYLAITETSGVLSAVDGPFYDTAIPVPAGDTYYVPLARCDGTVIDRLHQGTLVLPGGA